MEQSIIDYLVYSTGNIMQSVEEDKEYKEISNNRYKVYERLYKMLTKEQREVFDKFEELETDERSRKVEIYLKAGIKMGMRLVAESMFD